MPVAITPFRQLASDPPSELIPGLWLLRGEGDDISGYTLLLRRPEGSFLVYNGGTAAEIGEAVQSLGGAVGIFVNDRHNAKDTAVISSLCDFLGAALHASEIEAKVPSIRKCPQLRALPMEPSLFAPDFEVIPLPGHTPGNLAYLWSGPENRVLFIGDTLVHIDGTWQFWVSKPNRELMAAGLEGLKAKEFDVIVSTSFGCRGGNVFRLPGAAKTELLDDVIGRLRP